MPAQPGYIPGLSTVLSPGTVPDAELQTIKDALRSPSNGRFYSMFPTSTPKYARNRGPRPSERTDSMARLYIHGLGPQIHDSNLASSIGSLFTGGVVLGENQGRTGGEDSPDGFGFFDFLLGSTSITYQEREQAVDTISDNTVIFYSGMTAPVLQGSGAFLNTYQDDQNVWFHYAYMECLRGSRLASHGQIASLLCDSFRYDGYMSGLSVQTNATVQNAVMFNFTFRVKQISVVTPVIYSAYATAEIWNRQQDPLVSTAPASTDDTTPTGVETARNPVSPRSQPAAVAAADAASRDERAQPESATLPPSMALVDSANSIAVEHTIAELAAQADAMYPFITTELNANGAISSSGDVASTSVPPNTAPETLLTADQQRVADIAGAANVQVGGGVAFELDSTSGRYLAVPNALPVIDAGGAVTVSAGVSADRIAAAAQRGDVSGPVYGQSRAAAPSTLPAYAQASQLPSGFADIYRVQGTVFAEAYARAASQVAVAQTVVVGRRSRRRRGSATGVAA